MKGHRKIILESPCCIGEETPAKKIMAFNLLATPMSACEIFWATQHFFAIFLKYLRYLTTGSYWNASSW